MIVSLSWLKRYVDIEEDPATLAHDLTMFGVNVENVSMLASPFSGVVFGKVLEVEKHPRADRLSLCVVDAGGEEPLKIVCGASNVRPGLGVPVAIHGSVLAGGFKIKKTKIRGEVSEGMICSEKELGLGEDEEGIIELDFELKPGESLEGKLGGGDIIFDIEVTPNRPDLLCHMGIAREIAALYRRKIHLPDTFPLQTGETFNLEIESKADCPRYTAAFIEDVEIMPSPDWMQQFLTAVGLKPINNIVDVTNFVLMEMGQPLHAFDREKLMKDTICVRRSRAGEQLITLDEENRELSPDILVIADRERPVALAGVMGGRETEVTGGTKRVLLESAMFERRLIRKARQQFKLETEASYRFEREGDISITIAALERACRLIEDIGAGRPQMLCADVVGDDKALERKTITLRIPQANRVMGTRMAAGEIVTLLERLGLESRVMGKTIQVTVPTFRRDIAEEIDLIEETARVYGYENIGREEVYGVNMFSRLSQVDRRNEELCEYLASRGFAQVITSSFMDPGDAARMGWREHDPRFQPIRLANPLTVAQSVLRTSLLPGLLNVVRRNAASDQDGIRIFELGKVFIPVDEGGGLPSEELHLAAVFNRKVNPLQWMEQQRTFDFFDMKGEHEALLHQLGILADVKMVATGVVRQGHIFNWILKEKILAEGGALSSTVAGNFDVGTPIFYFDLLVDALPRAGGPAYSEPSPYPAVKRDLCVIGSERVTFSDIKKVILMEAKHLDSISLFDYYRGGHLGEGKRSYTFRMSFRSSKGTLDDQTVDKEIQRILETLQRELQVILRME